MCQNVSDLIPMVCVFYCKQILPENEKSKIIKTKHKSPEVRKSFQNLRQECQGKPGKESDLGENQGFTFAHVLFEMR